MSDASSSPDANSCSSPLSPAADARRDNADAAPEVSTHSARPDDPARDHVPNGMDEESRQEPNTPDARNAPDATNVQDADASTVTAPYAQDAQETPSAPLPNKAGELPNETGEADKTAKAEPNAVSEAVRTPSFGQRCFSAFAAGAPVFLVLVWLIQSIPGLVARQTHGLYSLAEHVRESVGSLDGATTAGEAGTGGFFSSVQPVYDLFLNGLARSGLMEALSNLASASDGLFTLATGTGGLTATGAALATLLLLLATWVLALAAGYGKRGALAAACALFVMLALAGLPSSAGESLLTATIVTTAMICLYSGWIRPFAPFRLGAGFALTALAALSAGITGLVLPLLASLLFLAWRGSFRRAGALDGALGFGLLLVLLLGRAAFLALWGNEDGGMNGREELLLFIDSAFLRPLSLAWEARGGDWWRVFPPLLALCLPFVLLLPFLKWEKIGGVLAAFVKNRRDCPGHGWIWTFLASALLLFCLLGVDAPAVLPTVLVPLAVLIGQAVLSLTPGRSRAFYLALALLLLAGGIYLGVGGVYTLITGAVDPLFAPLYPVAAPDGAMQWGVLIQAGLCLIFALLLYRSAGRGFPGGSLLTLTLFAACIALPLAWRPTTPVVAPAVSPSVPPAVEPIPSDMRTTPEPSAPRQEVVPAETAPAERTEPTQAAPVQTEPTQAIPVPEETQHDPVVGTAPSALPAPDPKENAEPAPTEEAAPRQQQDIPQSLPADESAPSSEPQTRLPEEAPEPSADAVQGTTPSLSPSPDAERQE